MLALDRATAAVLKTAWLSIDMTMPRELVAPTQNVRNRLEAVRASQEQIIVAASLRDTLDRLIRLAELHAPAPDE